MRTTLRSIVALAAFAVLATALSPAPAPAQDLGLRAYGVRAGAALEDDAQFLVGGHADLGRLAENVRVQPLFTVGAGSDVLSLLLGGEAHYLFPVESGSAVWPYVGGGVGLHHVDFDDPVDDHTEVALLVAGGVDVPVQRWWGWFAEGRFVIADDTVFRVEGGINWTY